MGLLLRTLDATFVLFVTLIRALVISAGVVLACILVQHVLLPAVTQSEGPPLSPPLKYVKEQIVLLNERLRSYPMIRDQWPDWSRLVWALLGAFIGLKFLQGLFKLVVRPYFFFRFFKKQGMPGPSFKPIIGEVLKYRAFRIQRNKDLELAKKIAPVTDDQVARYGPIFLTCFGPQPSITIADPALVKEVLVSNWQHYHKTPSAKRILGFLGNGLVTADGDSWAWQRKMVNPSFSHKHLKKYLQIMTKCTIEAVERWASKVGEGPTELEMHQELASTTLDIIGQAAFGAQIGGHQASAKLVYSAFDHLMALMQQDQFSLLTFVPGGRLLLAKVRSQIVIEEARLRGLALELVQRRRASQAAGNTEEDDLLAVMMRQQDSETKQAMTDQQLVDECMTFLLAGHETTTQLVSWTLMLLARNPHYTDQLREEIFSVLGTRTPEHDDLNKLKLLGWVVHESLRLYPPVCFVSRQAVADTQIGKFKVPKGVEVLIAIYSMQTRKDIWGEDAKEFRPERFANGIAGACKHPFAFLPFGGGPRTCLGQNFAIMEAKIILIMFLQRFDFRLAPGFREANDLLITLRPKYGIQLVLEKRQFKQDSEEHSDSVGACTH